MGVILPPGEQRCIASTCYMAGGMPLAFTQEDFLVGTENKVYIMCVLSIQFRVSIIGTK